MEKFDLMKYMRGDYILQTRHGWRVFDLQLQPRVEKYKLLGKVQGPSGEVFPASWTVDGQDIVGQDEGRFDLIMIPVK
jgi:hypothetical protein